jgi:radical SAM superfamily enzyme YgiQ (UPF0313 family)
MLLRRVPDEGDILILNCPHWNPCFPPPGPLHVHEAVVEQGLSSSFLDVNLLLYNHPEIVFGGDFNSKALDEYRGLWDHHRAHRWMSDEFVLNTFSHAIETLASEISSRKFLAVGFSVSVFSKSFSLALARAVKNLSPNLTIILGGFECLYPEILTHYSDVPDYYVVGEAEYTAPLVIRAVKSSRLGHRVYDIPGVMANDERGFRSFQPTQPPQDLDAIAYPKYTNLEFEEYPSIRGRRFAYVTATRGCSWGRCSFCSLPGAFRQRSPQHVLEELSYLHHEIGVTHFSFTDQDANNSPETLLEICDLIIKSGLHGRIILDGQLRVSKSSDANFFRKLREAGFNYGSFGLESGCNKVLRLMKKGITREMAAANFRAAQQTGFGVGINVIVGFPGETFGDFVETLKWLIANRHLYDQLESLSVTQLLRSSYMADHPEEYGIRCDSIYSSSKPARCSEDWTTSQDPRNTRANRELRRHILLIIMAKMGVPVGMTLQMGQEPRAADLAENERNLWNFVEESLNVDLASKGSQWPAERLSKRAWRYYRLHGSKKFIIASVEFLKRRLSNQTLD